MFVLAMAIIMFYIVAPCNPVSTSFHCNFFCTYRVACVQKFTSMHYPKVMFCVLCFVFTLATSAWWVPHSSRSTWSGSKRLLSQLVLMASHSSSTAPSTPTLASTPSERAGLLLSFCPFDMAIEMVCLVI